MSIGGFGFSWGAAPPVLLYFQIVSPLTLRFCFENRFIKCPLILSSETLTLLYFASRIRSQCCMLLVLKGKVFIRGGGGGGKGEWGIRPPFPEFSGSTPDKLLRQLAKNANKKSLCVSIASMPTIAENKTLQRMPFQTQIRWYGRWFHLAFVEKLIQLNKLPPNVVKSFSRAKSGVWFFFCSRNRATNLHWALEALVVGSVGCLQREEICWQMKINCKTPNFD